MTKFNISITDQQSILDVLVETKKVLQDSGQHESIVTRLPLCVEISLQTAEGSSMILEFWTLSIRTDQTNAPQRANQVIYNRMSLLLKSLLSVTRVTPAYRVSRMKRTDSYDIYYRIYKGEPQTNLLEDAQQCVTTLHSKRDACCAFPIIRTRGCCCTTWRCHVATAAPAKDTKKPDCV
uniref:Autophagy-related protein 13 n=1 Tax=Anopheles minimus TaxID=112268 RepID=A0A182WKU2_9DIPT